jgi:uncharacterized membrane protein
VADGASARLDTFVDSAFAFSLTLMVVGTGAASVDGDLLQTAVASIPSFAIGFAIVALFWWAHVSWRALRGPGDWRSMLLSLALIFVVLIYIVPLRAMASSFAGFLAGNRDNFAGSIATLFTVYGLGFVAMSLITAMLFRDAMRNETLDAAGRRHALGSAWIWTILAGTGALSTVMSLVPPLHYGAPFLYSTLPITIGIFAWRFDWDGDRTEEE